MQQSTLDRLPEKVFLVGVSFAAQGVYASQRQENLDSEMAEARELLAAVDAMLVGEMTCQRAIVHPALYVGTGKAEEIRAAVAAMGANLVVFNHELSPMQERNLEKALQCRVLDRVGLILAIFAQRARSQEGKLQVELAQLTHLSSRLVRGYGHLQSQRGGIGMKGPGETQLETDRRLIQHKIQRLRKQIEQVRAQRLTQRKHRSKNQALTFALVGYTNAGKSSLFNRLTKAQALAQDQLFATLDTTARRLFLNAQHSVIIADTVGFVRNLPHKLVAAFAATLEETAQADLLLHVVDASHPEHERQAENVLQVLKEIHADSVPMLMVFNKIDRTHEAPMLNHALTGLPDEVALSALTGEGLPLLREALLSWAQALKPEFASISESQ